MKLAKYWTRETGEASGRNGQRIRTTARGWSNESMEAARTLARDVAQKLAQGNYPARDKHYLYGERALPEPVLLEFQSAVVTRNVYGAEVLNARDLMFVDIDKPYQKPAQMASTLAMGLRAFFGRSPAPAEPSQPAWAGQPEWKKIQAVAERNHLTGRAYTTAGGYRLLITSSAFKPGDPHSEDLLRQFDADPLYVRLCRAQESFRARLTPKPWRCGLKTPVEQSRFDVWESTYSVFSQRFATCQYMASFGSGAVASGFQELVQYHDRQTKAASTLPLA